MRVIPDITKILFEKVNEPDIDKFIQFAKLYNIFQESNSKFYDKMCYLIKQRLDREGLSYETVRPE